MAAAERSPIDRPLVKWRAKPADALRRRYISRSSVHAHPVFRSVGCTSFADAHQTPIWIQVRTHRPAKEQRHRPLAHSSPRKSSVPAAAQGKSHSARARREAASQPVGDSAARRIEPTNRVLRPCLGESSFEWLSPDRLPIYPGWPNRRYTNRRSGAKGPGRAECRSRRAPVYERAPSRRAARDADDACVRRSALLPVGCESRHRHLKISCAEVPNRA
jgi:hypothetical protein